MSDAGAAATSRSSSRSFGAVVAHHTLITDRAESGAGDETIRDIAGHVSKQMLKHYSHIRMEAKQRALEGILAKKAEPVGQGLPGETRDAALGDLVS